MTSKITMTSRERILTSFNHQEPDRCASFLWINPDAADQLRKHLGVDDYETALGVDRWRKVYLTTVPPADFDDRLVRFVPEPFRDRSHYGMTPQGSLYFVDFHPLQDANLEKVKEFPFYEPEWLAPVSDSNRRGIARLKEEGAIVEGHLIQPFREAWKLRGMENALCDFLGDRDIAEYIYQKVYSFITEYAARLADAGVDVVHIHGDLAMQDRMMVPPAVWREFDQARLTELIRRVKATNPHVKVMMHSDGDVSTIVPDLIAAGLDILNPIQPECMDPFQIKKLYGRSLVLHGAVSLQRTLPFGSPRDVKREVGRLIDVCGKDGGFVIGPANSVMKEIPVENVVALYEEVNERQSS